MKTYQYIEQPYNSPLNLDILNSTFSNLETLHQKAIQTGSELKSAIFQLPLNESEEAFKEGLYNEIQQTIDNNTIQGNLASAYDDLLKYQGDLLTNKGLVGRLNAQKNYLAYKEFIDSFEIPEDYKRMYKAQNPYYYEDELDENGNVIGGTTWQPVSSPTKVIDLSSMVTLGINRAAEEKGSSYVTKWLDKNGNITTNPENAYDGVIYNEITRQYERLGHDKILKSIYAVIDETAGAKESLHQDYLVAEWKYDNGEQSDIIDDEGHKLLEDEYLLKRIDPAAEVASYNHYIEKNTYGQGLATYKKGRQEETVNTIKNEILKGLYTGGRGVTINAVVPAEKIIQNENILRNEIKNELIKLGVSEENLINVYDKNELLDIINTIPITAENSSDIVKLKTIYQQYNRNNFMYETIMKNEINENYEASILLKSGKNPSINSNNESEKTLAEAYNRLFYNGIYSLQYTYDDYKRIKNRYSYNQYIEFDDNTNSINISNRMNYIDAIKVFEYLSNYETLDEKITDPDSNMGQSMFNSPSFKQLGGLLDQHDWIINFSNSNVPIDYNQLVSSELLAGDSFSESYLLDLLKQGIIDEQEFNLYSKQFNTDVLNKLNNTNFSEHLMYRSVNGAIGELVEDSSDRVTYGSEILRAINEGRAIISPAHVGDIKDPITNTLGGYYIKITPYHKGIDSESVKGKDKLKIKYDKNEYVYYIPGIGLEGAQDIIMSDPKLEYNNYLSIMGELNGEDNILTSERNPYVGNITLKGINSDTFTANIWDKEYVLNKEQALYLKKYSDTFEKLNIILDPSTNKTEDLITHLKNYPELQTEIDEYATLLSNIVDIDINSIEQILVTELTN